MASACFMLRSKPETRNQKPEDVRFLVSGFWFSPPCYTFVTIQFSRVTMRHAPALTVLLLVIGSSAFAADLGRAIGSVTIDGKPIVLQYAYAIDHQKNQLSSKTSDTKIILTDRPLPDGTKLD